MGVSFKNVVNFFAPEADKEEDGRDKWPSRTAFVLAAMASNMRTSPLLLNR